MPAMLSPSFRARRVAGLLLALVLLSLLDLGATLHVMRTSGMFEANPIAAAISRHLSAAALAGFKLVGVSIAGGILLALRRRWQAEAGAAIGVLMLLGVAFNWGLYVAALRGCDREALNAMGAVDPSWVKLDRCDVPPSR